jgi:hypothetical protein
MPARIQKYVDFALFVTAKDYGLFAHPRRIKISRVRNEAFVPNQQPCARENLVELLLVNVRVYKDLTADETVVDIDKLIEFVLPGHAHVSPDLTRRGLPGLRTAISKVAAN